jgi:histidinol-phosphate aminotransferase
MENPYAWPQEMVEQWLAALRAAKLNRYPDPAARIIKGPLRAAMHVPAAMDMLLGNGSDELIQMVCMAVAGADRAVLAPEPGFVMYRMIAAMTGMQYVGVPLNDDFSLDEPAILRAMEQHRPAVTFLAYPNNPTGNLFARQSVERIIRAAEGIVVVDEAYHAFADDTFMSDLEKYDNLLVMRTLSKMGLAGLRLGVLAGAPAWLQQFDKIRLPYNINVLTQASVEFALGNQQVLDAQTKQICADREQLFEALRQLEGITCFPSQANFVLFRTPAGKASEVFNGLLQRGVLIKNLSAAGGLLHDCLRVTVGTPEENAAFLRALQDVLSQLK